RTHDFGDARCHIAELRDESFADVAESFAGGKVEAVGGGMDGESGDRLGRNLRMAGEEEFRLRFSGRLKIRTGDRFASGEIGPAVPSSFLHAPKMIGRSPDRSGAAVVVGVFGGVELAIRRKSEAEWI